MSTIGWIIVLILVIPIIGLLGWLFLAASFVRVPSGSLGLVMIKGQATDTALTPGPHFVPALRRHMIEEYPSVELAYRAGGPDDPGRPELNLSGPPLKVTLGDRTTAVVAVTVRFRLMPEHLRLVHERFGPHGFFGVVRDETSRAVITTMGAADIGIDNQFRAARTDCEDSLRGVLGEALAAQGIAVTSVLVGPVDLGRIGEVIGATVRARYELEREQAEAATRMTRALNDADLQRHMTSASDDAWRYRQTDLWRDLVQHTDALQVALRSDPGNASVQSNTNDQAIQPDQPAEVGYPQ